MDIKLINKLIDQGAIFYCSHSGGKDSQAMYSYLRTIIPHDQIVVIHADLGNVEWTGVQDHIIKNIYHFPHIVKAGKTFLEMVRTRHQKRPDVPSWPSPKYRQCTSDLKYGPLMKFIRNDLKDRGLSLCVNCTGIRAEESSARSKKVPLQINKKMTLKSGVRTCYDWMPIFDWSTEQVFDEIYRSGQKPFWAYGKRGELNERLSCVFCIMGSKNDLRHGAEQRPELLQEYLDVEKETGYTMFRIKNENIPLDQYIKIKNV